jgi:peptidoglycan lytic transglycosylase
MIKHRVLAVGIVLAGVHFDLALAAAPEQSGVASIYSSGRRTASGERLNPNALTAAHRKLPFGTRVLVTNKKNGRSVEVTINDRGPFIRGRIIDLTPAGARALGFSGLTKVVVVPQPRNLASSSNLESRKAQADLLPTVAMAVMGANLLSAPAFARFEPATYTELR